MQHQGAPACLERPAAVRISTYQPELCAYFKSLNVEWISKYFEIEPEDLCILDNPENYILRDGGEILFAILPENGQVVGTCALVKKDSEHYELAKMAVTEAVRGRKIGKQLLSTAIEKAKELGGTYMTLETNSQLTPAIHLYKSLGFVQMPFEEESPYARADVFMRLDF